MENLNIEDLKNNMEKLNRIRVNQLKANKKYYEKNKIKITEKKKQKYTELKFEQCNFLEIQRQRAKDYYEKNKELIKKKNLDRYHQIKNKIEFPEIQL